jgi:hypothetical protein
VARQRLLRMRRWSRGSKRGVFRPITARFLQLERIEPRELGREFSAGQSLGYAFCAGLCSFKTLKRIVEGTL